jgi:hypothetical protein
VRDCSCFCPPRACCCVEIAPPLSLPPRRRVRPPSPDCTLLAWQVRRHQPRFAALTVIGTTSYYACMRARRAQYAGLLIEAGLDPLAVYACTLLRDPVDMAIHVNMAAICFETQLAVSNAAMSPLLTPGAWGRFQAACGRFEAACELSMVVASRRDIPGETEREREGEREGERETERQKERKIQRGRQRQRETSCCWPATSLARHLVTCARMR